MSSKTYSAILQGLTAVKIEVEVDQTGGLPVLVLIGLATSAVAEAKERITTALQHCQLKIATKRTIVNLAPTDLKKSSPSLDLAILVALIQQNRLISLSTDNCLFLGEVGLSGQIKAVKGILPILTQVKKMGFSHAIIPKANLTDAALVTNCQIIPIEHISELIALFREKSLPKQTNGWRNQQPNMVENEQASHELTLFNGLIGQSTAKRALEIAAAGRHHLLFIGPPGSGKSHLAQSMTELLPPLNPQESLETTAIHSVIAAQQAPITKAPFRSPHHSISKVGLLGGGADLSPGEISLAHHGVLFLDELLEFDRDVLEALRQPLEQKQTTIIRSHGSATYPSHFNLIAASNPCPCGYSGSTQKPCSCLPQAKMKYQSKLSGPLLDRIDLIAWMEPTKSLLSTTEQKTDYPLNQAQLARVRKIRHNYHPTISQLSNETKSTLRQAETRFGLSTRGVLKLVAVAQTIALLQNKESIANEHILEALQFRWSI